MFPDPTKPVTANYLVEMCRSQNAPDIVIGAPSVIEEILSTEGDVGLEVLRSLRKFWFFVGAPVPTHFGNLLVKEKIHFLSMLGSTEIGQMNVLEPDGRQPEDWQYHQLRPDLDFVLEPRGPEPGTGPFELIILSKGEWTPGTINITINGRVGYSTSDLYQKHPSDTRLFKHSGRADDVIVLSNGEKTLSRRIEAIVESHPLVNAVIVFGTGRNQNGLLIEPVRSEMFEPSDEVALASFRNLIWEVVEKANKSSPGHSQIWKEMTLVTSPGKELPRTDKGSVRRKNAIQLYEKEIDALYLAVESVSAKERIALPSAMTLDSDNLLPIFETLLNEAMGKTIGVDEDVFAAGMDSLKAIFVRNSLLSALRGDKRTEGLVSSVPQNFVFLFTTANSMASALASLVNTGKLEEDGGASAQEDVVNRMVEKYTASFPSIVKKTNAKEVIILTGSTGSLGSFILYSLLNDMRVDKVYCFNRQGGSVPTPQRQLNSFKERQLDSHLLSNPSRIEFLDVDLVSPFFGLDEKIYNIVHSEATLIIHNAWALNFNWQLSTFENVHIAGLRAIVDFALTSPSSRRPRVAFTSSIASVGAFTKSAVPEQPIVDPNICLAQGYARSKFVGERILALASEKAGLETITFRIGQISGDTKQGIWNVTDHVPVLLRGCQELGAIPRDWLAVIPWIPVDTVANTIRDVVLDGRTGTFHITNPTPRPWSDLLPAVQRLLLSSSGKPCEFVTMAEWLERLKASDQSAESNPAIKLIAFFENNMLGKGIRCKLAIQETVKASETLRETKAVDEKALELWVGYWKSIGYLRP
jgi:thioester reductase-like protein